MFFQKSSEEYYTFRNILIVTVERSLPGIPWYERLFVVAASLWERDKSTVPSVAEVGIAEC